MARYQTIRTRGKVAHKSPQPFEHEDDEEHEDEHLVADLDVSSVE